MNSDLNTDSAIGLSVAAAAIVALAIAMYRQGALGRRGLVLAVGTTVFITGFLLLTL